MQNSRNTETSDQNITNSNENRNDNVPQIGVQLSNGIGEMNSFINVIIHLLYHIKEISDFVLSEDFPYEYKCNLVQELKLSFEKYNKLLSPIYYPKIPIRMRFIDVKELKYELNELYKENRRMKAGSLGDPIDVLFMFINSFHNYSLKNVDSMIEINEEKCDPMCLSHNLLYNDIIEEMSCISCGYKSELFKYDNNAFFYEIQVKHLIVKNSIEAFEDINDKLIIREKAFYSEPKMECPVKCNHPKVLKKKMLMKSGKYFLLAFSYETIKQKEIEICKILILLPLFFPNRDLFTIYSREYSKFYLIKGIVCKKGMNEYVYFNFNYNELNENKKDKNKEKDTKYKKKESYWVYHEDMKTIKIVQWKEVIEYSLKNMLTPILVVYKEHPFEAKEQLETQQQEEKHMKAIKEESLNIITKEDYERYIYYCQSVEKDSILTYMNENSQSFRLRPVNQIMKVTQKELQEMINKLKSKVYENRRSNPTEENNDDLIENLQTMLNEEKNEVDRALAKQEENRNRWQCTKCYLFNLKNCYRCERCKYFDYDMYRSLINKPLFENEVCKDDINIKDNKNKIIEYNGMLFDKKERKETLRKGGDNCWQCGYFNPFHCLKCKKCRFAIHQMLFDNGIVNDYNYNYNSYCSSSTKQSSQYKRVGFKKEYYEEDIQEKHIAIKSYEWKCIFCNQINKNSTNTLFCTLCFKNKSPQKQ